jgi:hypothetical protein
VGPTAGLDAVEKRKIPSPCWDSNSRTLIVQPVASSYTDPLFNAMLYINSKYAQL